MACRSAGSFSPRISMRWGCFAARTPSNARSAWRRIDEPRPLRDGGWARGARAAEDAHEGVLRLLDDVRCPPEREYLSRVSGASGDPSGAQRRSGATGGARRARARVHRKPDLGVRAEELFLS